MNIKVEYKHYFFFLYLWGDVTIPYIITWKEDVIALKIDIKFDWQSIKISFKREISNEYLLFFEKIKKKTMIMLSMCLNLKIKREIIML